jgi:hypothetical protein
MEEHVLSNGIARLDAIRILSGLDRKKPNWITTSGTVSHSSRADVTVHIVDAAASTDWGACCTSRHASNAEGAGGFNA